MSSVACPECGTDNEPTQRFCGACGTPLALACPSCGSENPPGFRFCGECGTPLPGDAPAAASSTPFADERRWATVLFADISGFTSMTEEMDPEDVRALADHCASVMSEEVRRFGGTVISVMGDSVMAVFGAPVAHEDDPERAVRAGLAMRDRIASDLVVDRRLQLHVGINTGDVMAGAVGPEERRDYTVMGDTTNTAARLMSAAPTGAVLVGRQTYEASHRAIRYEPVEPITAKGKQAPVEAWAALAAASDASERPVSGTPLVGRDAELELLRGLWRRSVGERRPHLVTVVGPPGIGKTRLMLELGDWIAAQGGQWVRGRSLPYGESSGYGAFAEQVRAGAGILSSDPVPEARRKLAAHLAALSCEDESQVEAHLAAVLGLAEAGPPDKQILFRSARRYLESVARRTPTAFVFEDIHWADPSLLDLLENVGTRAHDAPMLLLSLARPELFDARPGWGGGQPAYSAVTLQPLEDADALELTGHLLRRSAAESDLAERLIRTSGGNPLFLEELAASISEEATDLATKLPSNVTSIIAARLDALPADTRRRLQDAAVVGKVFWRGALARLGGLEDLDDTLDDLGGRDLVRAQPSSRLGGDQEFVFRHMLIREVAYAGIPKAARRERHREVAGFLEDALGERVMASATSLAHHWEQAGDEDRAVRYLLGAAELSARAWAKSEAIELYTRALALVPPNDPRHTDALRARAEAWMGTGNYAASAADLDEVLPATAGTDRARALVARGRSSYWLADAPGVERFATEASEAATQLGDPLLQGQALDLLSSAEAMHGNVTPSIELSRRAVATWPEDGRAGLAWATALTQFGQNLYWAGEYQDSERFNRAALEVGMRDSVLYAAVNGGAQLGMALTGLGRHGEALEVLERTVALGMEWELVPRFCGRAMNTWAGTLREIFDLRGARELNERALELGRRAAFQGAIVSAQVDLLQGDLAEGEYGRAAAAWPEAWAAAEAAAGWHQWLWTGRLAAANAELQLATGHPEEAVAAAKDALARAGSVPRRKYWVAAQTSLGEALLALEKPGEAADALKEGLAAAQVLRHPPTIWRVAAALSRASAASGRDDDAEAAHRTAAEAIQAFAEGLPDDRRAGFVAAEPVRRALAAG